MEPRRIQAQGASQGQEHEIYYLMYVKEFTLVLTDIIKYLQKYFKIGCLVMVTDRFCTGGLWSKVIVKKKMGNSKRIWRCVENNWGYERSPVLTAIYSLKWHFRRYAGRCADGQ